MKSEIKFLLELVLEHKLPPEAKKHCLERIGEVESNLIAGVRYHIPASAPIPGARAKSAAQLKYEEDVAPISVAVQEEPMPAPVPSGAPRALPAPMPGQVIDKQTGRPMMQTGRGTTGPRKF